MKRRLSDKIVDSVQHAHDQGRPEVARRLDLIYQSVCDDEEYANNKRRFRKPHSDFDADPAQDIDDD